jgi:hypothetical protein
MAIHIAIQKHLYARRNHRRAYVRSNSWALEATAVA